MSKIRNPRYAPELLERRLSPSSLGFSGVAVQVMIATAGPACADPCPCPPCDPSPSGPVCPGVPPICPCGPN